MSSFSFSSSRNKIVFLISFVVIFGMIFSLTYAIDSRLPGTSIESNIVYVDEEAYESLEFNSNNFELTPILDKTVNSDNEHAIKLSFLVGGDNRNNIDNIVYDISLTDLMIDCELVSPYLKWRLIKNDEIVQEGSMDYKFDTIKNGRLVLTPIQQDLKDYNEDKSTYDKYTFYMWLSDSCQEYDLRKCIGSEDQSNLLNKKVKGKVSVDLTVGDKKELVRSPSESLDINSCISEMETMD